MPEDDSRFTRSDFPSELPDGVTVAELPDEEIQLRAQFVAALFDHMTTRLRSFVAAGCPHEESEPILRQITNVLELSEATFRGAAEWRESREEALQLALAAFKLSVANGLQDVPPLLTAALSCDAAFGAEEEFFELVRQSIPELRAMEARAGARRVDRRRLH